MNLGSVNPVFLFIIFAMGYVFGLLLKKPSAGKFIIFGFFGVFIYEPVKDAGLLASGVFVLGIILHHVNLFDIFEQLWDMRMRRAESREYFEEAPRQEEESQQEQNAESAEETQRKYEEHVNQKRKEEAEKQEKASQQKSDDAGRDDLNAQREAMRKEQERMRREKARADAERERFAQEQASHFAPDTRSHEEVLGLSGHYSLDDLKKARSREVRRWNPSNMVNKPKHLVKQAEEEMKMINLAYDALKKQFE